MKDFKKTRIYMAKQVRRRRRRGEEGQTWDDAGCDDTRAHRHSRTCVRIFSFVSCSQSDSDTVSPEELDALKSKESVVQDALAEQRARNAQLDSQIRALQNEPSDEELAKQIAQYQKQIDTLNAKLARFKNDKNPVTKVTQTNTDRTQTEAHTSDTAHTHKRHRVLTTFSLILSSSLCGRAGGHEQESAEVQRCLQGMAHEEARGRGAHRADVRRRGRPEGAACQ